MQKQLIFVDDSGSEIDTCSTANEFQLKFDIENFMPSKTEPIFQVDHQDSLQVLQHPFCYEINSRIQGNGSYLNDHFEAGWA